MTRSASIDDSPRAGGAPRRLHHVGEQVADALGLRDEELAALSGAPHLPRWESHLRVGELAYDSAALSSLAIALVAADRTGREAEESSISPEPARIQASYGSERLFRMDGESLPIWAPLSGSWRVDDGWVRTHGNYAHHAERLTRVLGVAPDADRSEVEAAMRRSSRVDLEDRAAAAGALVFAVRDASEWRRHPHRVALVETPVVGFARVGEAPARAWRPDEARPLTGIRVLDLTRVIAGPVATRDLALAGADVLRIDSPRLPEHAFQHFDTAQEKRSTLLDLTDADDLDALQRLLATADVVVHGYRPAALERFGLDADSLIRRFPGIVVAQLSAWGTDGPWGTRRGFDSLVQAATGIALLESRDGGSSPGALPVQALDHSTGHFLAASITTALREQRVRGGSFRIDISLARIADEFLAAGAANDSAGPDDAVALPTQVVAVLRSADGDPATITCAVPFLHFPGAPGEYPSRVSPWGRDRPVWID